MRPRASAFIATSLDGFIARPDGSIDWLDDAQGLIPEGEDCGYLEFMASIDVIVMGRHTFEQVLTFDPWPYGTTAASPSRASCVPACSMKSPSRWFRSCWGPVDRCSVRYRTTSS